MDMNNDVCDKDNEQAARWKMRYGVVKVCIIYTHARRVTHTPVLTQTDALHYLHTGTHIPSYTHAHTCVYSLVLMLHTHITDKKCNQWAF